MVVLLFYTRNQGYLSQFFEEVSVRLAEDRHEVHNFSLKSRAYQDANNQVLLSVEKKGGYLKNYYEVFKIIKALKPDVVLSNFSYVNPALLFGRLFKVQKNIVWFHSLNEQTNATAINIFIKRCFLQLADIVIANSHHTKDELCTAFQVPQAKIETVPFWSHISDQDVMGTKTDRSTPYLKIGCPGRLVDHKNQSLVLEALACFNKNDYQCHIAGSGPNEPKLRDQAAQLSIESQLVFRGHLSAVDMITFYQEMDVIILPSLAEAFGLVFIEAISLGRPVIVSSKFGALTFIEKKDLLQQITFDPLSRDSLVERLTPYFNNSGLPSNYFKDLYITNFDKDLIFGRLQNILLKD